MDENVYKHIKSLVEITAQNLKQNNFDVYVFSDISEANSKILEFIKPNDIVGLGGSQTLKQMKIPDLLIERGNKVLIQKPGMSIDESIPLRREALTSDVYISSPNAVVIDGSLMFCDGVGNRVAGMIFGPKLIIAIAGFNKIVSNESLGWDRIYSYAAPINARRLNLDTPCVKTGICSKLSSMQCICNVEVVIRRAPRHSKYVVMLIMEELGY